MMKEPMHPDLPENRPRVPDHPELCEAVLNAALLREEEYFRRANYDKSKVPPYTLPPIPDTLEQWEAQRAGILQDAKECVYGIVPPAPDKLELKLPARVPGRAPGNIRTISENP